MLLISLFYLSKSNNKYLKCYLGLKIGNIQMRILNRLLTYATFPMFLWPPISYAGQEPLHEDTQVSLNKLSLEQLPCEIFTDIVPFTQISDGMKARGVSRTWNTLWDTQEVWKQYARRLPGCKRAEEEAREKSSETGIDYKQLFQYLVTPRLNFIEPVIKNYGYEVYYKVGVNLAAISGNGEAVVGHVHHYPLFSSSRRCAFIWREKRGMLFLDPQFLDSGNNTKARYISDNGNVILGKIEKNQEQKACVWAKDENTWVLWTPDEVDSHKSAMSGNGKVIISTSKTNTAHINNKPFISNHKLLWTQ